MSLSKIQNFPSKIYNLAQIKDLIKSKPKNEKLINVECYYYSNARSYPNGKTLNTIKLVDINSETSIDCIKWDSDPSFNLYHNYVINNVLLQKYKTKWQLAFTKYTELKDKNDQRILKIKENCQNLSLPEGVLYSKYDNLNQPSHGWVFGKILNIKWINDICNFEVCPQIDKRNKNFTFTAFSKSSLFPLLHDQEDMQRFINLSLDFFIKITKKSNENSFYYNILSVTTSSKPDYNNNNKRINENQAKSINKKAKIDIETNNQASSTKNTPDILPCSVCRMDLKNTPERIKPLCSGPVFNGKCTHVYCKACFDKSAIVIEDNLGKWDGYPMVSKKFRQRYNTEEIYSCELCKL